MLKKISLRVVLLVAAKFSEQLLAMVCALTPRHYQHWKFQL